MRRHVLGSPVWAWLVAIILFAGLLWYSQNMGACAGSHNAEACAEYHQEVQNGLDTGR